MNILQVQDALKNASDMQLAGELQNPTGLAPSYLVLSEMKRRQQMRQGAMASPAPQSSMAEEAASQAQPDYYPEEQPQEEEAGIEAFREGGVVRMQEGGEVPLLSEEEALRLRGNGLNFFERMRPRFLPRPYSPRGSYEPMGGGEFGENIRLPEAVPSQEPSRERSFGELIPPIPEYAPPTSNQPRSSSNEVVPPQETSGELPVPPTPPGASSQPRSSGAVPRGGAMPSGQPSGQTTDPGIQALYDRLRATGRGREDYRKDAVNTALMQAGLAMMASKDPNALGSLGQGGLRGLEAYTQEMREGRLGERQGIQDEITIRRAQTEEAYRRGIITNQERQLRLRELQMGQAAADRAEARETNNAIRLEQINQRNVQALVSSLGSSASQINKIETELGNMGTSPERREVLNRQLAALQRNDANIRRRLAQVGGAEYIEEAPTQNTAGLPPNAQVVPFRVPGGR